MKMSDTTHGINRQAALLIAFATLLLVGCQSAPTQFALIGDNPYADYNFPKYERMIDRINATPGIDWVLHVGDMKDGIGDCSDESLEQLYTMNSRFRMPFVLTPGDNDWFDCQREQSGGWDRLNRLEKLREIFYTTPVALPVMSQSATADFPRYTENVYWMQSQVTFATVHLVGVTGEEGGMDLHEDLQSAAVAWLDVVFDAAKKADAKGVFLATQADIYPFTGERHWLLSECPDCPLVRDYYEPFHEALLNHTRTFKQPIVLAVGDTHIFRVDKPLYDGEALVEHFTRVEAFGEDQVHWVRVVVRPQTSHVFEFHQEIIPENVGRGWSEFDRPEKP